MHPKGLLSVVSYKKFTLKVLLPNKHKVLSNSFPLFQLITTTTLTHKAQQSLRSWLVQINKECNHWLLTNQILNSFIDFVFISCDTGTSILLISLLFIVHPNIWYIYFLKLHKNFDNLAPQLLIVNQLLNFKWKHTQIVSNRNIAKNEPQNQSAKGAFG